MKRCQSITDQKRGVTAVECGTKDHPHHFTYAGSRPRTGMIRCIHCGESFDYSARPQEHIFTCGECRHFREGRCQVIAYNMVADSGTCRNFQTKLMRAVKVVYSNGDEIVTNINGTDQEIQAYFKVGKLFNLGNGETDLMARVEALFLDIE